ncbi:hypothetical protein N657DRAFT_629306 [Parathielavia appendiculata]|uniref:Uncharacterized protein n=1 Tax=Parathielavia appendiculata TaxID=2587402 RepID=A0AAN6U7Z5_9PEZI|nr:hypothetical protein N657DRAFT_629306 [Parathielavia appendiculata]
MAATSFKVPQISEAEMTAFHQAHFSKPATDDFHAHFLRPDLPSTGEATYDAVGGNEYYEYYEEEEDGLGYYSDGVKRTLTDEQIAIFRHSELQALRRKRESSQLRKATTTNPEEDAARDTSEEGEILSTPSATAKKPKKRKRGKVKNSKTRSGEEPIDLRKRTWDVVDEGLATLDYGDEENKPVEASAVQRRRISYDD